MGAACARVGGHIPPSSPQHTHSCQYSAPRRWWPLRSTGPRKGQTCPRLTGGSLAGRGCPTPACRGDLRTALRSRTLTNCIFCPAEGRVRHWLLNHANSTNLLKSGRKLRSPFRGLSNGSRPQAAVPPRSRSPSSRKPGQLARAFLKAATARERLVANIDTKAQHLAKEGRTPCRTLTDFPTCVA